jgi:hypothetical protein
MQDPWKRPTFTTLQSNLVVILPELLMRRIKVWLGYPKGPFYFIFTRPLHLNMLLKLDDTFLLKV